MGKPSLVGVKTRQCASGTRVLICASTSSEGMAEGYGQWPSVMMAKSLLAAVKIRQCASGTRVLVCVSTSSKRTEGYGQWPSVLMAKSLLAAVKTRQCAFGTRALVSVSTSSKGMAEGYGNTDQCSCPKGAQIGRAHV